MSIPSWFSGLLTQLLIIVPSTAAIAWWLFKKYSEGWLEQRFKKDFSDHQHRQNRELEGLKLEINTMLDRSIKLHQKEFEALPEIWTTLMESNNKISSVLSLFQTYPNLSRPQQNEC